MLDSKTSRDGWFGSDVAGHPGPDAARVKIQATLDHFLSDSATSDRPTNTDERIVTNVGLPSIPRAVSTWTATRLGTEDSASATAEIKDVGRAGAAQLKGAAVLHALLARL